MDVSGSFYVYRQKAFCALQTYAKDRDYVVCWDREVSKLRRWADVKAAGYETLHPNVLAKRDPCSIFNWMEDRFLSQHDTLIVYSDFMDPVVREDTFYRTEFVVFGTWPGQKFFNRNVYRIGDFDQRYGVIPYPDHPALQNA